MSEFEFANTEIITSLDNSNIKAARSLLSKKERKFFGAFLVEGENLVREAIYANENIEKVFIENSRVEAFSYLLKQISAPIFLVSEKVLESLCDTVTPQGIVAQITMKVSRDFIPTRSFLVLDGLQDPGNVGTIIRSAVATGIRDIVLINTVDVFNPKVIRSSVGCIYHANFYPLSAKDFVEIAHKNMYQIITTQMSGINIFSKLEIAEKYALVIGNEGNGVSETLLQQSDLALSLPMNSKVESLNAGVSASVILYLLNGDKINF